VLGPRHQTDPVERLQRRFAPGRLAFATIQQRQLDVLDGRGPREQVEALEHEAEVLAAQQ
jgi:hypothetical protein